MIEKLLKVLKKKGTTYIPAPEYNEPEGILRSDVTFESMETDETERDLILATLWDYDANLDLKEGEIVFAYLQGRVHQRVDGTWYYGLDVIDIKKVRDFD